MCVTTQGKYHKNGLLAPVFGAEYCCAVDWNKQTSEIILNTKCIYHIVAVLTDPGMLKKKPRKNVYFLIVERGLCFCKCKNPGLLNHSDTKVKDMGENLGKLLDKISCLQKRHIPSIILLTSVSVLVLVLKLHFWPKIPDVYQTSDRCNVHD